MWAVCRKEAVQGQRTLGHPAGSPTRRGLYRYRCPRRKSFKDSRRRRSRQRIMTLVFRRQVRRGRREDLEISVHGFTHHRLICQQVVGDKALTPVYFCSGAATGRDHTTNRLSGRSRSTSRSRCPTVQWLWNTTAPAQTADRYCARPSSARSNAWLKNKILIRKTEVVAFADVQDCLVLVSSAAPLTRGSREPDQKAITKGRFVAPEADRGSSKHQSRSTSSRHEQGAKGLQTEFLSNKAEPRTRRKAHITIKDN